MYPKVAERLALIQRMQYMFNVLKSASVAYFSRYQDMDGREIARCGASGRTI